jgi:TP901 family phage tail tape measure protein
MATKGEADLLLKFEAVQTDVVKNLDLLAKKLTGLEKKLDETGKEAAKTTKKFGDSFAKAAKKVGTAVVKIGSLIGVGGLTGIIYKAVKSAASFEAKMTEVSTLLGGKATQQIKRYETAVRKLATQTSASADELTAGLYQVISAGTEGSETVAGSMRLLEASQKMAVAGVSDTLSSVDVLTTALNAYGASAERATEFSDQMFMAVKLGKLTLTDLSAGLGMVASAAAGANVSFGEVNAALAAMTAGGVPPARAITSLNAIIRVAAKGSKELDKALGTTASNILQKKGLLGVMEALRDASGGSTIALQKMGIEQEAIAGLSVLAGTGVDKFRDSLEKMGAAAGTTEEAYGKMTKTFEFQKKVFWNKLNDIMIEIGQVLMPIIIDLLEDFGNWVTKNKDSIRNFFTDVKHAMTAIYNMARDFYRVIKNIFESIERFFSIQGSKLEPFYRMMGWKVGAPAGAGPPKAPPKTKPPTFPDPMEGWTLDPEKGWIPPKGISPGTSPGIPPVVPPVTPPKRKGPRDTTLLWEPLEGGFPGMGLAMAAISKGLEQAAIDAAFALTDTLREKQDEFDKFAEDFAASSVDSWYQKIGGPELETIEEQRAYAFAESLAQKEAEPGFWDEVVEGFANALGERLFEIMEKAAGILLKPFDQIMGLLGMAFGGEGPAGVRSAVDLAVEFWENLAKNLGPILEYLAEEGIPRILDAFVESLPAIIDAIIINLPKILNAIIDHIPDIIEAIMGKLPEITVAIIEMIPEIALHLVTAIVEGLTGGFIALFEKLIDMLTLGLAGLFGGGIPEMSDRLRAELDAKLRAAGKLPPESYHSGGVVKKIGDLAGAVAMFGDAIRAHSGLFVRPRLAADEIPIIAQAGEGIIRKSVVDAMGGAAAINALNRGETPGGDTHVHLHTEHMYAKDASEVVDDLQADMWRRGKGRMRQAIDGDTISGYSSRRS